MNYQLYLAILAAALSIHSMVDILMKSWPFRIWILWFALVVLIPVIGPLIYYAKRKSLIESGSEV